MNSRAFSWLSAALVLILASSVTACNNYYTPPPPVLVTITSSTGASGVALLAQQTDTTTNVTSWVPGTLQLTAAVANSSNQNVTWSINNGGADVPGGNATLGTIDATGLYTAPATLPNPSTIVITATPQADTTRPSNFSVQIYTPLATVTSVTPAAVVAGKTYTLTVNGTNFYNTANNGTATVNVSGAQVQPGSITEAASPFANQLTVKVLVTSPGLLQVAVQNPGSAGTTNPISIVSEPASPSASSALGVLYRQVGTDANNNPVEANVAYVPQTTANTIAVVNLDAGTKLSPFALASGFNPTAVATNPDLNTIVAVSGSQPQLAVLDGASGTVLNTWPVTVAGTAQFSDGSCKICGIVVDAPRNLAVLDTADGYLTVNLATGAPSTLVPVPSGESASENFTYDPVTQRVYAPWYTSSSAGINVIDLTSNTLAPYKLPAGTSFALGTQLDAAALDQVTEYGIVADEATSQYTGLNLNNQTTDSNGNVVAPASQFQVTAGCGGGWEGAAIEPYNHLGFFTNSSGCIAAGALAQASISGTPAAPASLFWSILGAGPDGVNWTNASMPHALTTYVGLDGTSWGLALRQDQAMLVKVNLQTLMTATVVSGGTDTQQVDPSTAVTYIPLN